MPKFKILIPQSYGTVLETNVEVKDFNEATIRFTSSLLSRTEFSHSYALLVKAWLDSYHGGDAACAVWSTVHNGTVYYSYKHEE